MLQKLLDDIRDATGNAVRLTSLAAAAGFFLFIALCFLCAAAFVAVLERYGLLYACLAGGGVFFAASLIATICYAVSKNRRPLPKPPEEKSAFQTAIADPMVLAMGLQVLRTVGAKRLIPILAVAGVAIGLMAQRHRGNETSQDK
ncbi:MAG: hypothetical protein EKK40_03270 [Bradyrhizobiaceae bacterium]|nr:MAG: hypothetical protein EKK40_03270 [Bradyrhizobiaceae bacterium]